MITYQEEGYFDVIDEILPLLYEHWGEIAIHRDKIELKPDFKKYIELYKLGYLKIFTSRDDEKLIGYFIVTVYPHIHYSDTLTAMVDITFLKKEYRGKMVGYKMFSESEKLLKKYGVDLILQHVKIKHDFGKLLERQGYEKVESVYSKYIGD